MIAPTPTTTPEALAFYQAAEQVICRLSVRWTDERDHENLADYLKPLQPIAAAAGVTLVKMTARPFGVTFTVAGKTFHAFVRGWQYQYKRIA